MNLLQVLEFQDFRIKPKKNNHSGDFSRLVPLKSKVEMTVRKDWLMMQGGEIGRNIRSKK